MSIRQKFLALMGLLVTLIVMQALIAYWSNSRADARLQGMYSQQTQNLAKLGAMLDDSNVVRVRLLRATLAATPEAASSEMSQVGKLLGNVEKLWGEVKLTATSEDERKFVDKYEASLGKFVQQRTAWIDALKAGDFDKAKAVASDKLTTEAFRDSRNAVRDLFGVEDSLAASSFEAAKADSRRALGVSLGVVLLSIIAAALAAHFILRPIVSLLQGAVRVASEVSQGNLTEKIVVKGNDEITQLLAALEQMQNGLRDSVRTMRRSAGELSDQAQALTHGSQEIHTQATTQGDAMNSAAAAIEELTVSINVLSSNANEAHQTTEQSGQEARAGVEVILGTTEQMHSVASTVNKASSTLQGLGAKSQQINQIVDVIREIADQTNLLALNAAIEAARAGEQGRGFAVVADEVRKLAERTGQSTQQIAKVIEEVLSETDSAIHEMEDGVVKVEEGTRLAEAAGNSIRQIVTGTDRVSSMVTDISSAIREQTTAAQDIAKSVEHVAQMSEEAIVIANANAASARALQGLSQDLDSAVARFRLD
ncbi:methyl-accepting chemotaxis protein [Uliginosibacterium sp. 31-16]|uniref:methyl-accepting chemotaxis protein n=1 Tax=Uliginosibacterium sp. 31-16 TaxID=3068315 RepID=UPI00273E83B2|nr:methyl-accepting chemotaxis protein [Uliginosibacterium sp. 31-16]MDP5241061.1 methyl-accepting chemotaxis protein [Uliginosibacterium sp. 31-16]